jgi:hypothetical protein
VLSKKILFISLTILGLGAAIVRPLLAADNEWWYTTYDQQTSVSTDTVAAAPSSTTMPISGSVEVSLGLLLLGGSFCLGSWLLSRKSTAS